MFLFSFITVTAHIFIVFSALLIVKFHFFVSSVKLCLYMGDFFLSLLSVNGRSIMFTASSEYIKTTNTILCLAFLFALFLFNGCHDNKYCERLCDSGYTMLCILIYLFYLNHFVFKYWISTVSVLQYFDSVIFRGVLLVIFYEIFMYIFVKGLGQFLLCWYQSSWTL